MSKARKTAKKQKQAEIDAKKVTPGKILRIFFKVLAINILFVLALAFAEAYMGWKVTDKLWVQIALLLGIVVVAQPFVMSEFRPKK